MPRARTPESEDVVVVKKPRAPRARATSVDGFGPTPRKRAPRKTVSKTETPVESVAAASEAPARKAPTALASERKRSVRHTQIFVVVATLSILLVGAGVVVGMFDHGQIDVVSVVTIRNEKIARGEVRDETGQLITTVVPAQTDNRPNGGLTIATPTPVASTTEPAVPAPTATTTATSTTEVATSTASTTPVTPDPALKPAL